MSGHPAGRSAAPADPLPTVGFVSLGCPKALVDSERILTQLRGEGYALTNDYFAADVVVVNTCGFIDAAVEESLEAIGEALSENGQVIVTGCLGAKAEQVRAAHPAVLAVTGPQDYAGVMAAIHAALPPPQHPLGVELPPGGLKLTPRHYAYLKIAEGCQHRCSFCIIPSLRGDLVSRPLDQVLLEAEHLVSAGVRELLVVAQDTAAYGWDNKYRPAFWRGRPLRSRILDLSRALGELGVWVRLHYLYPYAHIDDLVELMAEGVLLPYLDVPMQHADPELLRAMRRPAASERLLERIARWRDLCPDLTIRSTFIVGFPGETEAAFDGLLDFLSAAQLDRVGCFAYSPVAGAAANALPGAVAESLKQERRERLMAHQAAISRQRLERRLGQELIVLVDEVTPEAILARGPGEAPEIDGWVVLDPEWELDPGDWVKVRVRGVTEHDLLAEPVDEA